MGKRMVGPNWYRLRFEVLERDKFQCQYCGQYAPNVQLEVDHILPVSDGGTDILENLKTACFSCNQGKVGLWEYHNWLPRGRRRAVGALNVSQVPTGIDLILAVLEEPKTAKEIALAIGRKTTSVGITLRRMERRGLVTLLGKARYSSKALLWSKSLTTSVG